MADEELLSLGPRQSPRRLWIGAAVVVAVLVAAFVAVRMSGSSDEPAVAATSTAPQSSGRTTAPVAQRAWPTAPEACGGTADLPIISSTPVGDRPATGLHLLVGGRRLSAVDFDSGQATVVGGLSLRPGEFVVDLIGAAPYYAVIGRCGRAGLSRLVSLGGPHAGGIALDRSVDAVFADGRRIWAVTYPHDQGARAYLTAIVPEPGSRLRLPVGVWPVGMTAGFVVGSRASIGADELLLLRARTGRVARKLGSGRILAVGRGVVAWTDCDPSVPEPCTVYWHWIANGFTGSAIVPRPAGWGLGAISPRRTRLAFTLQRDGHDARYADDHPFPPLTVAVLDLDDGALATAVGIEIPAKSAPGLVFGPDGWLGIALDAGPRTRLLAWRRGLLQPYETHAVGGPAWSPPALAVGTG